VASTVIGCPQAASGQEASGVEREVIVVSREKPDLYESLKRQFIGTGTEVILDRRRGDRRRAGTAPPTERRRDERRSFVELQGLRSQGFARVAAIAMLVPAATASEIERTGPPTPRQVGSRLFTWTVPLNRLPPKAWRELFVDTRDRSIDYTPDGIRFYQATMIFDSDEERVATWIQFITRWIASANQRYDRHLEAERRARVQQADLGRDP
jgi:hypothetical protein